MTPKERAEDLIRRFEEPVRDITNYRVQAMISMTEQAITAAIEEAKAEQASITAKAEREECLKILQKTYQEWVDGDWAPGEAFESARDRIRARGVTNVTY